MIDCWRSSFHLYHSKQRGPHSRHLAFAAYGRSRLRLRLEIVLARLCRSSIPCLLQASKPKHFVHRSCLGDQLCLLWISTADTTYNFEPSCRFAAGIQMSKKKSRPTRMPSGLPSRSTPWTISPLNGRKTTKRNSTGDG